MVWRMPGACTGLVLPAGARPPRPGDQGLIVPSAWVTFVQTVEWHPFDSSDPEPLGKAGCLSQQSCKSSVQSLVGYWRQ